MIQQRSTLNIQEATKKKLTNLITNSNFNNDKKLSYNDMLEILINFYSNNITLIQNTTLQAMLDYKKIIDINKKITALRTKLNKEQDNSKRLIITYSIKILEYRIKILRLKS